jgi:5-methyltetrahydropteroyltriglutamate--homocysteine methyltransferase
MELLVARHTGAAYDTAELTSRIRAGVAEVVREQVEAGLDIVNDGEFSKLSWASYFGDRLSGVEARTAHASTPPQGIVGREQLVFPEWFEIARSAGGPGYSWVARAAARGGAGVGGGGMDRGVFCTGPLTYKGQTEVAADIENLRAAAAGLPVEELYLTALAPATAEFFMRNEHYPTDEAFVFALAEAMREEYRAITEADLLLQLDEPALATCWQTYPEMSVTEFRRWVEVRVEALNHALRDIPPERVRLHVCWGSSHHPHSQDLPLEQILDLILKVNVQAYSFEAANPRHDHDWEVWTRIKLPDGKILIPGVVGHFTDFVEAPGLVAERLLKYANVVGRENVIGGTDCGLGTRVGHPSLAWAKFRAMAEGARQATQQAWGAPAREGAAV